MYIYLPSLDGEAFCIGDLETKGFPTAPSLLGAIIPRIQNLTLLDVCKSTDIVEVRYNAPTMLPSKLLFQRL